MITRITELIITNKEEMGSKINSKSLFELIKFLDKCFYFDKPSITIVPSGNFRCIWRNYYFAVEFLGKEEIQYVFFIKLSSGKTLRLNSKDDIKFAISIISQFR